MFCLAILVLFEMSNVSDSAVPFSLAKSSISLVASELSKSTLLLSDSHGDGEQPRDEKPLLIFFSLS